MSPTGPLILAAAALTVLLIEILLQGKDNSFQALRRSTLTWKTDCFALLLFFTNFTPVLARLYLFFVLQAGLNALGITPLIGQGTSTIEVATRFLASFLLLDFMGYWVHRFDHEFFDWGWITHRLHHSTTELNIASGWRFHPLSALSWLTFMMLPQFIIFGADRSTLLILFVAELRRAWSHSRLNTDFGLLGVFIVSPLFHRRHHDVHDSKCNYGGTFTVWDHLFGTYRAPNEKTLNSPTGISPDSTYERRGILRNLRDDTVDFIIYFARLPARAWRAALGGIRAS